MILGPDASAYFTTKVPVFSETVKNRDFRGSFVSHVVMKGGRGYSNVSTCITRCNDRQGAIFKMKFAMLYHTILLKILSYYQISKYKTTFSYS